MFSLVLITSGFLYPFVPRFENLSLRWLSSTLIGRPQELFILKLLNNADITLKENKKVKQEQIVDDGSPKRETSGKETTEDKFKKLDDIKRFPAVEFNKDIDIFKIESLRIRSDKKEMAYNNHCQLKAELIMNDFSIISGTQLVDWRVKGDVEVNIDRNGNLTCKGEGVVQISAGYLGVLSNDIEIEILKPISPIRWKKYLGFAVVVLLYIGIICIISFLILILIKSLMLRELAVKNPREFINKVYQTLCRAFRVYGFPKYNWTAHLEYAESLKGILSNNLESMTNMTNQVLEARFSLHNITFKDSQKVLYLFHKVKDVVLENVFPRDFAKGIMFRLYILEVLMVGL
jgi:hypothetical protein